MNGTHGANPMAGNLPMKLTLTEFTDLLDRHGADVDTWPAATRERCQQLLDDDAAARNLLQQQRQLDSLLDRLPMPEFPRLEARVLHQPLPPRARSTLDAALEWLFPAGVLGRQFWRPAMAACLPLMFGFVVGNFFSFGITAENPGFDYWDDELYMLSLNDYTENLF